MINLFYTRILPQNEKLCLQILQKHQNTEQKQQAKLFAQSQGRTETTLENHLQALDWKFQRDEYGALIITYANDAQMISYILDTLDAKATIVVYHPDHSTQILKPRPGLVEQFGFDGSRPKPPRADAKKLALAILSLIKEDDNLTDAKKNIPNYTGQYSDDDYTAEAQEKWNRAADHLYKIVMDTLPE